MNTEFFTALELLEREKGIPQSYMMEKIEAALVSAFKKEYGTTVNSYICDVRIEEAKRMLATSSISLSRIAEDTGFYDQSYFSKVFLLKTGVTPSEYRRELKKNNLQSQ